MRNLERRLADVCRKAATQVAPRAKTQKMRVDDELLREWLGPRRFSGEVRKRTSAPGVATGLAYTAAGGDVLFIEATAYPGQGQADDHRPARRGDAGVGAGGALVGAGARATSSASRTTGSPSTTSTSTSRPARCRRTARRPGVTMATAIASLVRDEPVADDVGMTGEITLTGPGAADRRAAREVARRATRGAEARDLPARERARPRRASAGDAPRARVHPGRHDRGGVRRRLHGERPRARPKREATRAASSPLR